MAVGIQQNRGRWKFKEENLAPLRSQLSFSQCFYCFSMVEINLLRVRIDHGDIHVVTFKMPQRFITVVVLSMWYRHRRLTTVKWLSCNGPQSYQSQKVK